MRKGDGRGCNRAGSRSGAELDKKVDLLIFSVYVEITYYFTPFVNFRSEVGVKDSALKGVTMDNIEKRLALFACCGLAVVLALMSVLKIVALTATVLGLALVFVIALMVFLDT